MTEKEGYRIVEQLGAGLAGPVFLAESESGRVVIRHFQPQAPSGTEQAAFERLRFVQSARRASTLKQPGIVEVLEVLDEGDDSFSTVEYVPHTTLKEALEAQQFSPEESTRLIRRMARTLHFANQNGVVHGDFKPSNVFLISADELKVSDFAVSPRAWSDPRVLPPEWAHAYLAPEYYADRDRIGPRSDQYALAATAYHLYTQRLPYRVPSETTGERRALPPASSVRPQIPVTTDAVLARALSNDPNQRFGSCLEFSEALTASFVSPPVSEERDRTRPLLPILIAVGSAIVIVLALALFWPKHPVSTSHVIASPQSAAAPVESRSAPATPSAPPKGVSPAQQTLPDVRTAEKHKTSIPIGDAQVTRQQSVETAALRPVPAPSLPPVRKPPQDVAAPVEPAAEVSKEVTLEVYSRDWKVERGVTFSTKDSVIGEMGQGDLKAVVRGRPPKGKLILDWFIDGMHMASAEVVPNKVVAYNNEPTTGSYRVVLRQNAKELSSFVFRITQ